MTFILQPWPKSSLHNICVHWYAWGVRLRAIWRNKGWNICSKVKVCACVCLWTCLCPGISLLPLVTALLFRKVPTGSDRWIWLSWLSSEMVRIPHTAFSYANAACMTLSERRKVALLFASIVGNANTHTHTCIFTALSTDSTKQHK